MDIDNQPKVIGAVRKFDSKRIKPDPRNPRKRFRGIPGLAENILSIGQTTPGKVTLISDDPNFDAMLVDGERRLRACLRAKVPFEAYVVERHYSILQRLTQALGANFNQQPHDRIEVAHSIKEAQDLALEEGKKLSNKELGQMFGGRSDCWVSQHISILKLCDEVQQMMIPPDDDSEDAEAERVLGTQGSFDQKVLSRSEKRRKHLPFVIGLLLVDQHPDLQMKYAKKIMRENMSLVRARRLVFKEVTADSKKQPGRKRSPGHASEAFGNKAMSIQDMLGFYGDMRYADFEHIFSTSSKVEVQKLIEILHDIKSNADGLADSLQKVCKKKT